MRLIPCAALLETQRGHAADAAADTLANAMIGHLVTLVQASALHYRLEPAAYQPAQAKPRLIPGAPQLLQEVTKPNSQVGMHNLWHHPVTAPTDALHQYLMRHIDGEHSAAELRTLARDALTAGRHPHPDGKSYKGARNLDPVAQEIVNSLLAALRRAGLLLH